jgi:hypothetical protein
MQNVINIREIEIIPSAEGVKIFDYDVLSHPEDQRVRRVNLDKAATLGKVSGLKANIVLKTPAGYKRIQTQVQGVDATAVWVENGIVIPLIAVYAVDIID